MQAQQNAGTNQGSEGEKKKILRNPHGSITRFFHLHTHTHIPVRWGTYPADEDKQKPCVLFGAY